MKLKRYNSHGDPDKEGLFVFEEDALEALAALSQERDRLRSALEFIGKLSDKPDKDCPGQMLADLYSIHENARSALGLGK